MVRDASPIARPVQAARRPVPGDCPECGAQALEQYEVLAEGGWFKVIKCAACLGSLERAPWTRYGHITRDHSLVRSAPVRTRKA